MYILIKISSWKTCKICFILYCTFYSSDSNVIYKKKEEKVSSLFSSIPIFVKHTKFIFWQLYILLLNTVCQKNHILVAKYRKCIFLTMNQNLRYKYCFSFYRVLQDYIEYSLIIDSPHPTYKTHLKEEINKISIYQI